MSNSHSPSVVSRLSCSPPTEDPDESDFEMEEPVSNQNFEFLEAKKTGRGGEAPERDRLEMEIRVLPKGLVLS